MSIWRELNKVVLDTTGQSMTPTQIIDHIEVIRDRGELDAVLEPIKRGAGKRPEIRKALQSIENIPTPPKGGGLRKQRRAASLRQLNLDSNQSIFKRETNRVQRNKSKMESFTYCLHRAGPLPQRRSPSGDVIVSAEDVGLDLPEHHLGATATADGNAGAEGGGTGSFFELLLDDDSEAEDEDIFKLIADSLAF